MATDNDVYQLTHTQQFYGVEVENVYFYQRGTGITIGAQELVEEWIEQVLPDIQAFQVPECVTTAVTAQNLFSVPDTYSAALNSAGTGSSLGEGMPPMVSAGFTLVRHSPITRNGSKRIAGIGEAVQENGIFQGGTPLGLLQDVADAILRTILGGLSIESFFPVIVGRILDGGTYRLPASTSEATVNAVDDVTYNVEVTTQNSRKFGVGS